MKSNETLSGWDRIAAIAAYAAVALFAALIIYLTKQGVA